MENVYKPTKPFLIHSTIAGQPDFGWFETKDALDSFIDSKRSEYGDSFIINDTMEIIRYKKL